MAKEAERLLADSFWLPEPLRTVDDDAPSTDQVADDGEALPEFLAGDEDEPSEQAEDEPQTIAAE